MRYSTDRVMITTKGFLLVSLFFILNIVASWFYRAKPRIETIDLEEEYKVLLWYTNRYHERTFMILYRQGRGKDPYER